jgi:hypothetical protein
VASFIEIAHPGESCRILRVLDVLEPRYRLDGPIFPEPSTAMGWSASAARAAYRYIKETFVTISQ